MSQKILIVDDDPAMLRLLKTYLQEYGYEALQATNGQDALSIVLREAPPIVVTDWAMPGMDGLALCRALREHEGVRFVYVVIVTAHSDLDRMTEGFDAGADDFLSKPVNKHELMARLRVGEHIARLESDLAKRTREIHRLNAEMAMANEKLAMANDMLKRMATTDELTGLLNRREAMCRLAELWAARDRYGHTFSCIGLDIDHFKSVNDRYGHAAGDAVLRECAMLLWNNVRTTDIACRVGGEEFLVLCPHVGAKGAAVCAEHLRAAIENHNFAYDGTHLKVTMSIGVAQYEPGMSKPDQILKAADHALYTSKQTGRNRVTIEGEAPEVAPVP